MPRGAAKWQNQRRTARLANLRSRMCGDDCSVLRAPLLVANVLCYDAVTQQTDMLFPTRIFPWVIGLAVTAVVILGVGRFLISRWQEREPVPAEPARREALTRVDVYMRGAPRRSIITDAGFNCPVRCDGTKLSRCWDVSSSRIPESWCSQDFFHDASRIGVTGRAVVWLKLAPQPEAVFPQTVIDGRERLPDFAVSVVLKEDVDDLARYCSNGTSSGTSSGGLRSGSYWPRDPFINSVDGEVEILTPRHWRARVEFEPSHWRPPVEFDSRYAPQSGFDWAERLFIFLLREGSPN